MDKIQIYYTILLCVGFLAYLFKILSAQSKDLASVIVEFILAVAIATPVAFRIYKVW